MNLGWLIISKIYKSYISWDSWRSLGISEWDKIKYINKCYSGAVLKVRTLYKGNVIKYKGKSRKSLFWNFKRLNIFKSCLMALVCIPEAPTDLLTPILPYKTISNGACQMRQMWHFWHFWHKWRIWHPTYAMARYGNMGVKRSVRASGMQTNAIKQLLNRFKSLKFWNSDFQNFPLYFPKSPLYNEGTQRESFQLS